MFKTAELRALLTGTPTEPRLRRLRLEHSSSKVWPRRCRCQRTSRHVSALVQPDGSLRVGEVFPFDCGPLLAPEIPGRSFRRATHKGADTRLIFQHQAGGTAECSGVVPALETKLSCRGHRHRPHWSRPVGFRSTRMAAPPPELGGPGGPPPSFQPVSGTADYRSPRSCQVPSNGQPSLLSCVDELLELYLKFPKVPWISGTPRSFGRPLLGKGPSLEARESYERTVSLAHIY